jgi:hypothetical protein
MQSFLIILLLMSQITNPETPWPPDYDNWFDCFHGLKGDLDDAKLVDAITGEKMVYRKRGTAEPQLGLPQVTV